MDNERIVSNPKVMGGKPVIRGTRIPVDLLLELLSAGWTDDEVLESWPYLTREDITAAREFGGDGSQWEGQA